MARCGVSVTSEDQWKAPLQVGAVLNVTGQTDACANMVSGVLKQGEQAEP